MAKGKLRTYQPAGKRGAKHFSVTVPTELLAKINAAAKKAGISRSYWVTKAAQAHLDK